MGRFRAARPNTRTRSPAALPDRLSLADLLERLDNAEKAPTAADIKRWLARTQLTAAERRKFVRFDRSAYRRNLVCRRREYELLVLCWRPGQRSPVHDHYASRCTLTILEGDAIELRFERDAAGVLHAVSRQTLSAGAVASSFDSDLHIVGNWAQPERDLITLHHYSPPMRDMHMFPDSEIAPDSIEQLRRLDRLAENHRSKRVACRKPCRGAR